MAAWRYKISLRVEKYFPSERSTLYFECLDKDQYGNIYQMMLLEKVL